MLFLVAAVVVVVVIVFFRGGAAVFIFQGKPLSRKHLRTKETLDFHLTYSKNGGNVGSESK